MLTAEGCRKRRERLWKSLPEPLDWILLVEPQHLIYLANYYPSPFLFRSQNAPALLLLGADGSSLLFADNFLRSFAEASHVDAVQSPAWYTGRGTAPQRQMLLLQTAIETLSQRPGLRWGIEGTVPAALIDALRAERPGLTTFDVLPVLHTLKRRKAPDEVEVIKKALRASEAGFAAAVREVKPGMTELQACERVHQAAFEAAQQPVIVYGDFASGPRCEQGGGSPTLREIQPNELFLLDFSVVLHGYRGDLAHTFVVAGGKATSRQREMAEVCYAAMAAGEALLKPGAPGREVYQAVQRVFAENHLGERFPHHAGHGLGLGHPDPPYFVPESDDTLLAGDVVTLEPGAYIPGIGGMRFEHNYLITENGFERLSRHSLAIEPR